MKSSLFVLAMSLLAGAVYAQPGPDLIIPYINPALITIDGLGTDWEDPTVYPQEYMLSSAHDPEFFAIVTGCEPSGAEDFSAVLYLGWSTDNMLYGYSRVTDDVLQVGIPDNGACWAEDNLEIVLDADNSGGDFRTSALHAEFAQHFGVRLKQGVPMGPGGNEDDTVCHIWAMDGAKWTTAPEFFYAVTDYPGGTTNVTYAYEFKLAFWDEVGLSAGESQRHDAVATYKAMMPIGLGIAWDDCDAELGTRDTQIGTMGPDGNSFWRDADHFNDAYLVDNPLYPLYPDQSILSDASVTPERPDPGSPVTILVTVTDPEGVTLVRAYIESPDETVVGSVDLSCTAGSMYAGAWTTSAVVGEYKVDFLVLDGSEPLDETTYDNLLSFSTINRAPVYSSTNSSVDPEHCAPGAAVAIRANVHDPDGDGVASVYADIESPDEHVVATVALFDDGAHQDGVAGDQVYANTWVTGLEELGYHVDIRAADGHPTRPAESHHNNVLRFSTVALVALPGVGPEIYIPYVDPTRIVIDGLGTDWEDPTVYPQDYMLSSAHDPDFFGMLGEYELTGPEDLSVILYLGWSTDNRLYGYSRVTDDVLQVGLPDNGAFWCEDHLMILLDADNSGGDYRAGDLDAEYAQQFGLRLKQGVPMGPGGNDDDTVCHISAEDGARWTTGPEFFYAVTDYPAGTTNVTYAYEFKLALWDEVGLSVAESRMHDALATYEAGVAIGLGIAWDDCDRELGERDTQISTMGPDGCSSWRDADYFNDAYLVDNPLYSWDRNQSILSDASVTPKRADPGSPITISATVTDPQGVSLVRAFIESLDETVVGSVDLTLEGESTYTGVWTTEGTPKEYVVNFMIEDGSGPPDVTPYDNRLWFLTVNMPPVFSGEGSGVDPGSCSPGDVVVIRAKVSDPDGHGIASVYADIESPDEHVIATVALFDDGAHQDGDSGDHVYANTWVTGGEGLGYHVDIRATDAHPTGPAESHHNNVLRFSTVASVPLPGCGPDLLIPYIDPAHITIDGLGTDWEDPAVYPQEYMLSSVDAPAFFGVVTGSEPSGPEDFSAILYLGWSTDNMIYGYSRVTDDVLQVGVPTNGASWGEDGLEIMTDAGNIGGSFRTEGSYHANPAQQFGIRQKPGVPMGPGGNEDDTVCHIWALDDVKWTTGPEFFYAVVDYPEGTTNVTTAYEFKLALWDEVGLSVGESRMHDAMATCEAGVPIGLAIAWDDCDAELGTRDTEIGTMGPHRCGLFWNSADIFNDAYLVVSDVFITPAPTVGGVFVEGEEARGLPESFALSQNHPNPFNPITTIRYRLPETGHVKLMIYDLLGKENRVLVSEMQPAGWYDVRWDGNDEAGRLVSSGVYFYRLEVEGAFLDTRKMVLVR